MDLLLRKDRQIAPATILLWQCSAKPDAVLSQDPEATSPWSADGTALQEELGDRTGANALRR